MRVCPRMHASRYTAVLGHEPSTFWMEVRQPGQLLFPREISNLCESNPWISPKGPELLMSPSNVKDRFLSPQQVKKGTVDEVSVTTPQPSFSAELPHMRRLVPQPRDHNLEPMEMTPHPLSPPSNTSPSSSIDLPDW